MKKKMEMFATQLSANEKKKIAGGLRQVCEPNGSYLGAIICCSGCHDISTYECIECKPFYLPIH